MSSVIPVVTTTRPGPITSSRRGLSYFLWGAAFGGITMLILLSAMGSLNSTCPDTPTLSQRDVAILRACTGHSRRLERRVAVLFDNVDAWRDSQREERKRPALEALRELEQIPSSPPPTPPLIVPAAIAVEDVQKDPGGTDASGRCRATPGPPREVSLLVRRCAQERLLASVEGGGDVKFWPSIDALAAALGNRGTFVQIGAHEGSLGRQQGDPIPEKARVSGWRGILVEPVPYLFKRLRPNYVARMGESTVARQLRFENSALHTTDGVARFYSVREGSTRLPPWANQIGSFDRAMIEKSKALAKKITDTGRITDDDIEEMDVRTMTWATFANKHNIHGVDYLQIDTEGLDYKLLRTVNLTQCQPLLLRWESQHLSKEDAAAAKAYAASYGYSTLDEGFDTFAWRTDPVTI